MLDQCDRVKKYSAPGETVVNRHHLSRRFLESTDGYTHNGGGGGDDNV